MVIGFLSSLSLMMEVLHELSGIRKAPPENFVRLTHGVGGRGVTAQHHFVHWRECLL